MTELPPAMIEFNPMSRGNGNAWDKQSDNLWLLTPEEYELVPDGSVLTCINGKIATKGKDHIDQDTRFGYLAYGFRESQLPPRPMKGRNAKEA